MTSAYARRHPRNAIIWRIVDGVSMDEKKFQRMVGATWSDAYRAGWDTIEDTLNILRAPDKPAVHLEPRSIRKPT